MSSTKNFRIANVINTALFDLICKNSATEKEKEDFYTKGYNRSNSKSKLINNLLTLSFHGAKSNSIVALSVLAIPF